MPALQKINNYVYLHRPQDDATINSEQTASPSLILMFAWMNAQLQHEQKFIEALHRRYPTATILLVKSSSAYWFSTRSHWEEVISPVVDIVRSRYWDGILIHMFCNGGGWMFTELHRALTKKAERSQGSVGRGPRVVCVLDSMPGDRALDSLLLFAAPSNPLLRMFVVPVFATAYGVWLFVNTLRGNPPLFGDYRRTLLSPSLLPTVTHPSDSQPPRLYIYSVKDGIVRYQDVERHIEEAKRMDLVVYVEKYEDTAHVEHMRADAKRYWDAVENLWARAKL